MEALHTPLPLLLHPDPVALGHEVISEASRKL